MVAGMVVVRLMCMHVFLDGGMQCITFDEVHV